MSLFFISNSYAQERQLEVSQVQEGLESIEEPLYSGLQFEFEGNQLSFELNLDKVDQEMSYILENKSCVDCFDEMHDEWFEEFILLQDQGYSLEEADNLAMTSATFIFKLCNVAGLALRH